MRTSQNNLNIFFLIFVTLFVTVISKPRPKLKKEFIRDKRYPNVAETTYIASGLFQNGTGANIELETLTKTDDWIFLNKERTYSLSTKCKQSLVKLANEVKSKWGGKYLLVLVDAYSATKRSKFKEKSLHYEGRAIDVTIGRYCYNGTISKSRDECVKTIYNLSKSKLNTLFAELTELACNKAKFNFASLKGHHLHLSCRVSRKRKKNTKPRGFLSMFMSRDSD